MEPTERDFLTVIEAHAREACRNHDPAHDASHLLRVATSARRIMATERDSGGDADEFVVLAACWLHDLIQFPKGTGQPGASARQSAEQASAFLRQHGLDESRSAHVAAAVRTHSYSGGERPATLEAAIVQDADRLDALGAVGIARLWVVAGKLDSKLYHPEDPLARDRPLDDARFALDHIERKLLKLPGLMNTAAGRQLAKERAAFLMEYRERFVGELGGESGSRE